MMKPTLIPWDETLSVGIPSIDSQHKKMIRVINSFSVGQSGGQGGYFMGTVMAELNDYTTKHFAHEEGLMDQHEFPRAAEHKKKHAQLIARVQEYEKKIASGEELCVNTLMSFLRNWVSSHIMQEDKKYALFLQEKGVT